MVMIEHLSPFLIVARVLIPGGELGLSSLSSNWIGKVCGGRDSVLYYENFEEGYLPEGWSLLDGNEDQWTWKIYGSSELKYLWGYIPPYSKDFVLAYSDVETLGDTVPAYEGAILTYPLKGEYTTLYLSFSWGMMVACGTEVMYVTVQGDTVFEVHSSSRGTKTIEISNIQVLDTLRIGFFYEDGGCWGWAVAVDNVMISESPPPPDRATCCLDLLCGPFVEGKWLADMAYDSRRDLFYQVEVRSGGSDILIWDPSTCEYCEAFDSTTGVSQRGIAYNPDLDVIYVGGWNQGILYTFEVPKCGEELNLINSCVLPQSIREVSGLAWDDDLGGLFIQVNSQRNLLAKFDPITCQEIWECNENFYWGGNGYDGAGLCYSPDDHGLFSISMYDNSVNFLKNPEGDDCVADTFCYLFNPVGLGWGVGHRDGESGVYWVSEPEVETPKNYRGDCLLSLGVTERLFGEYPQIVEVKPNPTRDQIEVSFTLEEPKEVTIAIYDVSGRFKKEVFKDRVEGQKTSLRLHISELPAGVYFLKIKADDFSCVKKLTLFP